MASTFLSASGIRLVHPAGGLKVKVGENHEERPMLHDSVREETRQWYEDYFKRKGVDRNNLLRNPEVLFQNLAFDASLIRALGSIDLEPASGRVLDVGCGSGGSTLNFLRLGFPPPNVYGIDILEDSISIARSLFPLVNWACGDAGEMEFADGFFDVVFESTMFVQITDDSLAEKIAREMLRVTKVQGHIILTDWRYSKPGDSVYKALSRKRIARLFGVGSMSSVCGMHRGALVPPLGRFLSKRLSPIYFPVAGLLPFLVGQVTTVLRKKQ